MQVTRVFLASQLGKDGLMPAGNGAKLLPLSGFFTFGRGSDSKNRSSFVHQQQLPNKSR
jgi:hypothetical protein